MFDIDLLNNTGLQKSITRVKVGGKKTKQVILFENSDLDAHQDQAEFASVSPKDNIISILIIGLLASLLFYFGTFNLNTIGLSNRFFSNFKTENMLSDIIRLMENSNEMIVLDGIELDDSFNFTLLVSDLEDMSLINNKPIRYTQKIYHIDRNKYKISFSHPLKPSSSLNKNQELSSVMQSIKNDYNVEARMYNGSILFTSDSLVILEILQDLIYGGNIKMWPIGNGRFNLEYTP
jgi:hypothetical protein